jgi:hypothetical protein
VLALIEQAERRSFADPDAVVSPGMLADVRIHGGWTAFDATVG